LVLSNSNLAVLVDIGARLGDGDKIPRHVGSFGFLEGGIGFYRKVYSLGILKV
jgi:hypothetical protein